MDQRFEMILQQMPAGVIIAAAPTGDVLLVNEQAKQIIGDTFEAKVEIERYEQRQTFQTFHSDGRAYQTEEWPLWRALFTGEVIVNEEIELLRSNQSRVVIQANAAPIRNPAGEIMAGVMTFIDITKRKQTEWTQRFLAEASSALATSLDYQTTLDTIAHLALPVLADACIIYALDPEGQIQQVAEAHVDPAKEELLRELGRLYRPDPTQPGSFVGQVWRTGETVLTAEVTIELIFEALPPDPKLQDTLRQLDPQSMLALPMLARGRVLGFITLVYSGSGRRYSATDLPLAEDLARRIALALDNARLYEAEQQARQATERAAERLTRLQTITAALSEALTPAQVGQVFIQQSTTALGAAAAGLMLLTGDGTALETVHTVGYTEAMRAAYQRIPLTLSLLVTEVIRLGKPVWSESQADFVVRYPALAQARAATGFQALALVPLVTERRTVGVVEFNFAEPRRFSPADKVFMLALTQQATQALERARLYGEAQRLNAKLEQRVRERTAELQAANTHLENQIAERRRVEAALAEERNLLRTLIDHLPDYIYIKDSQSRFITANMATVRGVGVATPEELAGKTDFDVFPPALAAQYYTDEQAVIQSSQPLINREEATLIAGQAAWASTTTIPLFDNQGQVVGVVGISRDITERKQMAAELAEVQHRLVENLERERIHLAQELHDGPVQDLYGVSYRLNRLVEALSGEPARAQLATVQADIQQVIQTLRATFSELRPPTLAPFGLEKAIRSHAEQFQALHPELKLELQLNPDGQALPERVRLALFRIYQEALNNIVRHAGAQQVMIRFSLATEEVILEVQDDGGGFEVPRRWVALARRGHLGLVGISERTEAIGGQLRIVSTLGSGTLIRVAAPRPTE